MYAIRQVDIGISVGNLCRQFGVSDTMFNAWKKKYAHLVVSAATAPAARGSKQPVAMAGR